MALPDIPKIDRFLSSTQSSNPWEGAISLLGAIAAAPSAQAQAEILVRGVRDLTGARATALRRSEGEGETNVATAGRAPSPLGELRIPLVEMGWSANLHLWGRPAGLRRDGVEAVRSLAEPAASILARGIAPSESPNAAVFDAAVQQQLLQVQKMDSLGAMAGAVAHDFNNLLAAIMGFAAILGQSSNLDADDRDNLEMIQEAGRRAADLTGRLLAFAKGGLTEFCAVDLCEVVEATIRLCGSTLRAARIKLVTEMSETPVLVQGDAGQLQQAILNIMLNARDALAGSGTVAVRVSVTNGRAVCTISDDGPGMDDRIRARIFEPFYTTKAGSGTGLGLAITYGIVQNHRGSISVRSAPGDGATFEISLPELLG